MIQSAYHGGRLAALLAAACLGLGALCYLQIEATTGAVETPAHGGAAAAAAQRAPAASEPAFDGDEGAGFGPGGLEPLDAYAEISERPLFDSSRRPVEPEPDPEPAEPSVKVSSKGFVLLGTTSAPEGRKALVLVRSPRQQTWVTEGDRLEGWLVEEIRANELVITRAGRSEQIALKDQPSLRRKAPKRSTRSSQPAARDGDGKTAEAAESGSGSGAKAPETTPAASPPLGTAEGSDPEDRD